MRGQQTQKTQLSRSNKNKNKNDKVSLTSEANSSAPVEQIKNALIPCCDGCKTLITDDVRALQRDRCTSDEAWKCISCLHLKPEIYDAIVDGATELKWFCNRCEIVVREEPCQTAKLEELMKLLERFLKRANAVEQKLSEKADIRNVSMLEESLAGLEERLNKQIEDRTKVVEVLCQSLPGAPGRREVEESIVTAVKDKIEEDKEEEAEIAKRKTNVIVFGLNESHSDDTEERNMEASCKISEMLHEMNVSGVVFVRYLD